VTPAATDDADPASLRAAIEHTLPLYERRGLVRAREAAARLLDVLDTTRDPSARRAAIARLFAVRPLPEPVLLTAYYEPELRARAAPDERFRHALYRPPPGAARQATRAMIDAGALSGRGLEVAWTDDPVDLFFLHVQGSGRLRFADGRMTGARFAATNGRPYTSLGRVMIERGLLQRDAASAADIRRVLERMSDTERRALFAANERYVFFELGDGPVRGSLGVPLTPGRSIAADPRLVPPGSIAYLDTPTYRRFVVVQDTGAAIAGARADLFLGAGERAGVVAGRTKERGRLYVLAPR
jgi:membrane-bound lytic murein transglycosylase A